MATTDFSDLTAPNTGNPGEATAADSPDVALMDRYRRQQQQQAAQLALEQGKATVEQNQANRTLAGQTAAGDASQWATQPEYHAMDWASTPAYVKQSFNDRYGTVPGGANGIAEQLPMIWDSAQRNVNDDPSIGVHPPQGQSAQVDVNGTKYTIGGKEAPKVINDPATGHLVHYDPATQTATTIVPDQGTQPVVSGDPAATGEDALAGMDPKKASFVKQLASYAIPLSMLKRWPAAQQQEILEAANRYDPSFSASQYENRQALLKSYSSGPDANARATINTVIGHINALNESAKQLHNRSFQPWNTAANLVEQAGGKGAPTDFDRNANAVASELGKLFKGTGAPTTQEIAEWRKSLSSSDSPEQLFGTKDGTVVGAIPGALQLMQSRIDALKQKYENGMGKPKDQKWLDNKSSAAIRKMGLNPDDFDPVTPPGSSVFPNSPNQNPGQPTTPQLSEEDQKAINWAHANPTDPRSGKILKLHGL